LVVRILAENSPERMSFSLRGMGFGFSLSTSEIMDPAMQQRSAPNHIITDGYLNPAGGRLGSMD
jgi:hypothetical protein